MQFYEKRKLQIKPLEIDVSGVCVCFQETQPTHFGILGNLCLK